MFRFSTSFLSLAIAFVACTDSDETVCGDGVCSAGETAASCPEDCGSNTPKPDCGDGVCNNDETTTSCPEDCKGSGSGSGSNMQGYCGDNICQSDESASSCPADCEAKITVENDSSYAVYDLYAWPCGSDSVGTNILSSALVPDYEITIDGPIGCFDFGAAYSDTIYWESDNNEVSNSTYTWTLTNANSQ